MCSQGGSRRVLQRGVVAGDGFVTDGLVVNGLGVSDATAFLSAVVSRTYRQQARLRNQGRGTGEDHCDRQA